MRADRPDTLSTFEAARATHAVGSVSRTEFFAAVLLACISAYVVAPFSYGDNRVLVPQGRDVDAILGTLLIGDGMAKLLARPQSYYDTAILYPDHNQLRTTEPFLGFALLGLPLKVILHLNDVDVFEILRWALVAISSFYAYLLFRAIGVDSAISLAGAVLCVAEPDLINGIERLQVVSIPLIFPVLYHGLMVWARGQFQDRAGLFLFAALYPLCGMINAMVAAMAAVFILPLLLKTVASVPPQNRAACLVPVLLAFAIDVFAIGPWLFDRSDLAVYVSDSFLRVKHWNAMRVPLRLVDVPRLARQIGLGVVMALALVWAFTTAQRIRRTDPTRRPPDDAPATNRYLWIACVGWLGIALGFRFASLIPWLQRAFQVTCWVTLLLYWRHQVGFVLSRDQSGLRNYVLLVSSGLGLFLCLMSFGPVYSSNNNLFANNILTVMLHVLTPLRSIREFSRIWVTGILFVSVYATVRLGAAVRSTAPVTRLVVAALVMLAVVFPVLTRPLVASASVEAPRDVMELATRSRRTGAIYVHPHMDWNSALGVWLIRAARDLRRPIVNGYLGIEPPWFAYASSVLHRFPDPEAMWLLRRWKVDTVVSLAGPVPVDDRLVDRIFEGANGAVYDVSPSAADETHPSDSECPASDAHVPIAPQLLVPERVSGGASLRLTIPVGLAVNRVKISFERSIVQWLPESIGVYAFDGLRRISVNHDRSGEWIESLAADALVRRRSPVATIRLDPMQGSDLEVEFRNSEEPPIESIVLCGRWTVRD